MYRASRRAPWDAIQRRGDSALLSLSPSLEAGWAVLCGCLAAAPAQWDAAAILRALVALFLVEGALGIALAQGQRLMALRVPQPPPPVGRARPLIPYAAPCSPGERISLWLAARWARWRARVPGEARGLFWSGLAGAGAALVLATLLGLPVLLLALAISVATVALAVASRGHGAHLSRWLAGLRPAAGWAIGSLALGGTAPLTFALAAIAGLGAYARASIDADAPVPMRRLLALVWLLLVGFLVGGRYALLAAPVAAAALAENMSLAYHQPGAETRQPAARLGWLISLLAAALVTAQRA